VREELGRVVGAGFVEELGAQHRRVEDQHDQIRASGEQRVGHGEDLMGIGAVEEALGGERSGPVDAGRKCCFPRPAFGDMEHDRWHGPFPPPGAV